MLHFHVIYTKIPTLMVTRMKCLYRKLFNFFLSVSLSKPITDSTVIMPIGVSYPLALDLGQLLDWNGRYKLMAGVGTGAGAPNTLLPEGPDPCRGPQYLGLWDTMCEADARGGVQTLLTVHTIINGKETFLCEKYRLMRSKIRLDDYSLWKIKCYIHFFF